MNSSTGGRPPFGPSRRPRNNTTIPSTLEPYYSANIFRYKCIGQLKLSSDHVGSPGICRGLQFQTELVAKMQPGTREQCIKRFLDASADYSEAESEEDAADQKVKEIYTSRTLIYRDDTEDDVDYYNNIEYDDNKDGDNKDGNKNSNNKRHNSSRMIVKKKTLPEEDLIDKTSWSCNGSTNVHYLVLKPEPNPPASAAAAAAAMLQLPPNLITENNNNNSVEKKSASNNNNSNNNNNNNGKIVAITPDNIGIAVRKIDSQVGHFTMIDFGSIRICLETPASAVSSDNDDNNNKNGTKEEKELQHQQQLSQQQKNNNNAAAVANSNAATLEQSGQKVYDFSLKMIRHMNQNQKMLRDAVADDFPARAMVFGHKIINRFGKTVDQTWEYMGKMIDMVWRGSGGGSGRF